MEQRGIERNRGQAQGERFHYWVMRSGSPKLKLLGFVGVVLLCLEYFFLFPQLGKPLVIVIGSLTLVALVLCPIFYLNYGYRHLKR